jgi:cell fate regulator YaaT (PSP1 superfamily)
LAQDQLFGELKPVLRRATQADLDHLAHLQQYEPEALQMCTEKVVEHKLPMHLIKAEYNFDGSRLTFFFTADKRVDFRALVRDLARTFRTRIELRQVGPRDEAKLLGGIGPCGRLLCCSTFLPDFARVSIKMAKDQDLPLNPSKISGVCGRLLCCLSYEHEQYLEIKAELPQRGDWVQTPEGPGEVITVNVVKENVVVELTNGNTLECSAAEILEVKRRVVAEAQSRNAEGITPVARGTRHGPHPIIDGEEGLLTDDPEMLLALEDLEDTEVRPGPSPSRAGGQQREPKQPPLRPDAMLGPTLSQNRRPVTPRAGSERTEPTASTRTEPAPGTPSSWTPQMQLEPHKELSAGMRPKREPVAATQAMEQEPDAATEQSQEQLAAERATQAQGARRRKRSRGRGGKS